jgi:hypothetical protein
MVHNLASVGIAKDNDDNLLFSYLAITCRSIGSHERNHRDDASYPQFG